MNKRTRRLLLLLDGGGKYKTLSGAPPLSFTADGSVLKDYRIYGQTENGESVGDRTGNLFDVELVDNYHVGQDGLPSTYSGRCCITTPISINTESLVISYAAIGSVDTRCMYSVFLDGILVRRVTNVATGQTIDTSGGDELYIGFYLRLGGKLNSNDISNIMLNEGSTALPYEPYGYRVPVTVTNGTDTQTKSLYLPEQIKMVGDEAEYIDFKEQKQHKVRKNLIDFNWLWDYEQRVPTGVVGNFFHYIELVLNPNTTYNVSSDYPYSFGSNTTAFIVVNSETEINTNNGGVFGSRSVTTAQDGILKIARRIYGNNSAMIPNRSELELEEKYIQVEKGSIATEYESYIESTELDVELPALPTLSGTNTLSVGTEVQPSAVEIRGRISAVQPALSMAALSSVSMSMPDGLAVMGESEEVVEHADDQGAGQEQSED